MSRAIVTVTETIEGRGGGSLKPTDIGRVRGRGDPRETPSTLASPSLTQRQPRAWYHFPSARPADAVRLDTHQAARDRSLEFCRLLLSCRGTGRAVE